MMAISYSAERRTRRPFRVENKQEKIGNSISSTAMKRKKKKSSESNKKVSNLRTKEVLVIREKESPIMHRRIKLRK